MSAVMIPIGSSAGETIILAKLSAHKRIKAPNIPLKGI